MNAETETYKKHEIEIEYDEHAESPREWDNICVFHVAHRNYSFGDENYNDSESIHEAQRIAKKAGDIVLPLYMYDHSGITISLTPFSCRWDSGQVGFVQIPRKKMIEEFEKKIFTPALKKKALKIAESEVKTLDCYIRGDVYGYVIDEDSCWGYYSIKDAMDDAKGTIDGIIEYEKKKHFEKLKTWIKNKVPIYARTGLET